jgi:hypothetical protein
LSQQFGREQLARHPSERRRSDPATHLISVGAVGRALRITLRRHFGKELQTGATKLKAKVGHFMIATIFGTRPPDGFTPIKDERVRGRLGELFLKTRLGWRETDSNQHEGLKEERPMDIEDVRRRIRAKLARLAESERGANSGEPTGT